MSRTLYRWQNLHNSVEGRGFLLPFASETKQRDALSIHNLEKTEINIMSQANLRSRSMMTVLHIHCTQVRRCYSWFLGRRFHNICTLNLRGSTDRQTRATTTCKRRNFPTSSLFSVGRDKLRPRTRQPSVYTGIHWSTKLW